MRQYIWDEETLLSVTDTTANETYYYFADANKNIGQLVDASGNIVAKYEYSLFGGDCQKSRLQYFFFRIASPAQKKYCGHVK
ncbi:MAG: hypothetical protein JXR78_07545, partial [Victivallales bacterium]|nr:hypothetical protein [Victivallales bacterium]